MYPQIRKIAARNSDPPPQCNVPAIFTVACKSREVNRHTA